MVFAVSFISLYFSLRSTGTVKTGLPTQILKNHEHFKSPYIGLKMRVVSTFFKRIPKFAFFRRKIPLVGNPCVNKCLWPGPAISHLTRTLRRQMFICRWRISHTGTKFYVAGKSTYSRYSSMKSTGTVPQNARGGETYTF
jgi:hypothetical protein